MLLYTAPSDNRTIVSDDCSILYPMLDGDVANTIHAFMHLSEA